MSKATIKEKLLNQINEKEEMYLKYQQDKSEENTVAYRKLDAEMCTTINDLAELSENVQVIVKLKEDNNELVKSLVKLLNHVRSIEAATGYKCEDEINIADISELVQRVKKEAAQERLKRIANLQFIEYERR
jgi:hypothetical protein